MDILRHDIATYRIMTAGFVARDPEFVHPKCLSDLINMLTPYRMAVPALLEIATIAITIPVGTAGCERVFSVMRRVKTWLRCQTTDDRLSDLAIVAVHRKRAKELGANNWAVWCKGLRRIRIGWTYCYNFPRVSCFHVCSCYPTNPVPRDLC